MMIDDSKKCEYCLSRVFMLLKDVIYVLINIFFECWVCILFKYLVFWGLWDVISNNENYSVFGVFS